MTQHMQGAVSPSQTSDDAISVNDSDIIEESDAMTEKPKDGSLVQIARKYVEKDDHVLGVDIVQGAVRLCEMVHQGDHWKVIHIGESTLEMTEDKPIADFVPAYAESLKKLVKKQHVKVKEAAIALPVHDSVIKTITMPLMQKDDIEQAIAIGSFWENFVTLPDSLDNYAIHYEVIGTQKEASTMDILFVAAKKTTIQPYIDIIEQAGLQPHVVDVRCFALFHVMQQTQAASLDETIAYLKIDEREQYMYIVDQGEPFMYELFLSDNDKNDIAAKVEDHEFLKRLSSQIKQSIATHQSLRGSEDVKTVRLLNTADFSKNAARMLKVTLPCYEMDVKDVVGDVSLPKKVPANIDKEHLKDWAVVMGLAMRKLDAFNNDKGDLGKDNINLLPNVEQFKKVTRLNAMSRIMLAASAAIVLIGVGASFFFLQSEGQALIKTTNELQPYEQKHTVAVMEKNRLTGLVKKIDGLKSIKGDLPANQQLLLDAYDSLYSVIPQGVWLSDMAFTQPGELEISGSANGDQNILELIRLLSEDKQFDRVSLKTMQASRDKDTIMPVKQFSLVATLANVTLAEKE